jgi:hypothetical protein
MSGANVGKRHVAVIRKIFRKVHFSPAVPICCRWHQAGRYPCFF